MRKPKTGLVCCAVLGAALITGCGGDDDEPAEPSASEVVCDLRAEMGEDIQTVADDIAANNFGAARESAGQVASTYDELRGALGDLSAEEREAVQPQVDAVAAGVSSLQDVRSLDDLSTTVDSITSNVETLTSSVNEALNCP